MKVKSETEVYQGQHITVIEAECEHAGKPHKWEYVTRGGDKAVANAVMAIPLKRGENINETTVILIKQFRPPLNDFIYELPAGLIDDGETPEQAAMRELTEETGFTSKVAEMQDAVSPVLYNSPGLTDESIVIVVLDVDVDVDDMVPTQALEPTEDIKVVEIPIKDIYDFRHTNAKFGAKCFLALILLETLEKI